MKRSDKKRIGHKSVSSDAPLRLPKALYTSGMDEIVSQWDKKPSASESMLPIVRAAMALEGLRIAEALVISPSVCAHVYGENVVLCRLIDAFGIAGVERLLEEHALQFLLWRPTVMFMKEECKFPGLEPILAGNANDPAHSDPQASVEMALKGGWTPHPWPKLERLSRLATERTVLPAQNVPHDAVSAVKSAYDGGSLRHLGFNSSKPRYDLGDKDRGVLSRMAEDVAKGIVLCDLEFDVYESELSWGQLLRLGEVAKSPGVNEAVQRGLTLEGVPNIQALIARGIVKMGDVPGLRNDPATVEFRRWLWSQPDPRSVEGVSRAWLASISEKPLKDKAWFKVARLSFFGVVSTVVGAAVTSAAGPEIGTAGGLAAGTVVNEVIGGLDTFGLDAALRKPGPRRFADLLRKKSALQAIQDQTAGNRQQRRADAAKKRRDS